MFEMKIELPWPPYYLSLREHNSYSCEHMLRQARNRMLINDNRTTR